MGAGKGLNYRQMDVGTALLKARALFKPTGKIHTPVHYFAASESREVPRERWNDYCHRPVKIYEIDGDHFSIFKQPVVERTAQLFAKTFHDQYPG